VCFIAYQTKANKKPPCYQDGFSITDVATSCRCYDPYFQYSQAIAR
jgi:hypothetical protein